jgi:chromosome partitioning protein
MLTGTRNDDPHVITTLMNKGGAGKSTFCVSAAAAIAAAGGRVLVVDMDQQRNATILMDPVIPEDGFTVYDVIAAHTQGSALDACYPSAWMDIPTMNERAGRLDVLPGDSQMTEQHIIAHGLDSLALALQGTGGTYDVVLIDCPPSTGLVVQASLVAASHAVLVSQPQHLSILGLAQSLALLDQFNAHTESQSWGQVALSGVVINQYDHRRTEHRDALSEVREAFGQKCWTPAIPERAVVQKAAAAHYPLLSYPDPAARSVASVFARSAAYLVRSLEDPVLSRLPMILGGQAVVLEDEDLAVAGADGQA